MIYMLNVWLPEMLFLPLNTKEMLYDLHSSGIAYGVCTHPRRQEGLKLQGSHGTLEGETRGKQDKRDFISLEVACLGTRAVTCPQGRGKCGCEPEDAQQNSRQLVTGYWIHPPCHLPFIWRQNVREVL